MPEITTFEEFLDHFGVRMTEVSDHFGIPYRTLQNWKAEGSGRRQCPDYVLKMMVRLMELDRDSE